MNNKPHGICACGEHAWTMLTRGYVAFADPEDLPVIQERSWSVAIRPGSETRRSYPTAVGHARKKHIRLANRIAGSETMLDHADRDSMNCRRRNLRPADAAQNARNRRPKLGRIYKGVMKNGKRWRAGVWFDGANRYSGPFDTPEEAAMAYNRMALALQGEFAVLNDLSKLSGYPLVEGKQGVMASSSTVCGEGTLPSPSEPPRSAGGGA